MTATPVETPPIVLAPAPAQSPSPTVYYYQPVGTVPYGVRRHKGRSRVSRCKAPVVAPTGPGVVYLQSAPTAVYAPTATAASQPLQVYYGTPSTTGPVYVLSGATAAQPGQPTPASSPPVVQAPVKVAAPSASALAPATGETTTKDNTRLYLYGHPVVKGPNGNLRLL